MAQQPVILLSNNEPRFLLIKEPQYKRGKERPDMPPWSELKSFPKVSSYDKVDSYDFLQMG
jgi:hypothetical protein